MTSVENIYTTDSLFREDNFTKIERTPTYFGCENNRLLGWLHKAPFVKQGDCCVVLCPPLGVEYMSTYRSIRYIADYFALAGIPALRFDYHGTGDSSGYNRNEDRVPFWIESIEQAYQQIKLATGCSKVGMFGLRLGATLATLAAEKLELEFLILWSPLESGRRYIREIKTIQMTGAVREDEKQPSILEAGGIVYWPDTEYHISGINLLKIIPKAEKIVIIPRDDMNESFKLHDFYKTKNLNVTQISLPGSSDMLLDAYFTKVPHTSISKIVKWVKEHVKSTTTPNLNHPKYEQTSINQYLVPVDIPTNTLANEITLKDKFFWFGENEDRFAITSINLNHYDHTLPKIIIINSGATHRVGPSRLYVTLARQLCGYGFQVFRIDIPGLGDSYVDDRQLEHDEYIETSSTEIKSIIDKINKNGEKNTFILTGLCSGAYFSFHAALDLQDENIVESILINPLVFYWEKGMSFENSTSGNVSAWNWYKQAMLEPESWKKLFGGNVNYKQIFKTISTRIILKVKPITKRIFSSNSTRNEVNSKKEKDLDKDLMKITENNTHLTFVLSKSDPGYDLLMTSAGSTARKLCKQKKLDIIIIKNADHTFSKFKPRKDAIISYIEHIKQRYIVDTEKESENE